MPNNIVFSNPGAALVQWGNGAATPYLTLSGLPSTGTVGVAVTGLVTNPSAATATWTVSSSPADAIISPSSGTLAPGVAVAFTLTALASGLKNVQLTSTTPNNIISGSPHSFTAASVAPPPPPPAPAASALTLSMASTGTTGSATLVTVTPNAAIGATGTATLSVSGGGTLGTSTLNFTAGSSAAQSTTLTRTTDGLSTVTMTNNMGLTNIGSPANYTSSTAPVVSTAGGTASFSLSSTAGATLAPFTIGMALREGQFPGGITVSGVVDGQASVRNTWPDGSAKFAIISGRATVPAGSGVIATLQRGTTAGTALTEADLTATGVTATLQFAGGTVMSLASLIGVTAVGASNGVITAGRVRTLTSGPTMSSWLYCAPLSAGNAHIVGWMEVRLYVGGAVHVLPWVENGWTRVSSCAGQAGTLTFTLGGTTRFTQADVHLANHCRVVAQDVAGCGYWLGTAPDLYCAPDPAYIMATGLAPQYFPDTSTATTRLNALTQAYSPTTYGQLVSSPRSAGNGTMNGDFDTGMADSGYHAGIGPLPEWDVFYLTSEADQRAWKSVIANAMGYGRYGVHFRDETTLAPFSPADGINKTLPQGSNHNIADVGANQFGGSETLPTVAAYDPSGANLKPEYWAQTHHPSAGFMAYLLTGQEFFLELSQFVAGTCFLRQNNIQRDYGNGYQRGYRETTRGAAWALRSIFQAATISVDGSALQTSFKAIATNNVADYLANYVTSPCGSYGATRPYSNFNTNPAVAQYRVNAWELDFSVCAWGYGLKLKPVSGSTLTNMGSFFQWHAQWVVHRLGALSNANTYGFNAAGRQNSICTAPSYTDAPWVGNVGPWYATPGEVFQDTHAASNSTNSTNTIGAFDANNGFFPDATSYWGNLQTALAYAVEHGVAGAWEGYLLMVGASNWSEFDTSAATSPVGALRSTLSPPAWRSGMTSDAFNTLTGTTYSTAATTLIPTVSPFYRGTGPREAVVDAYGDPAFDPVTGCFYLHGGGHGDGTYNGVIKFDPTTKTYSVVGQPTPPSVYLSNYAVLTTPTYYPSGPYFAGLNSNTPQESPRLPPADHLGGYFLTVAEGLNATTDAGYVAPALARISSHQYAAMVIRGRKIHFFSSPGYGEFDIDAGTWSGWDVDIGGQLKALQSNLTNYPFSQGNAAVYDELTDRFIVTLQPGDYPMGNRNGVFVFDPVTRTVESILNQSAVYIGPSPSMVKVGRKVYMFYKTGNYLAPQVLNQGLIYDIDAKAFSYFTVQGNPSGTIYSQTTLQETIPAWTDGTSIHRWNYEAANSGNVHTLNLTPVSGTGTFASPYILAQTSRAVTSAPTGAQYRYRGNYWPAARAMVILPKSNQEWRVLPLS